MEVANIQNQMVSDETRTIYINSLVSFLQYMFVNQPSSVLNLANNNQLLKASLKDFLQTSLQSPNPDDPIHFELFNLNVFLGFLTTLRKSNGSRPGYSTYNSHRSALNHLFKKCRKPMPQV